MALSSKKIARALISSMQDGVDTQKLLENFNNFMDSNHLVPLIPNVMANIQRELHSIESKKTAKVKVSHSISEKTLKEIETFIKKENSDPVKIDIDESLIGGFQATYKGMVYDGSVKNYLKELRVNLMK